MTEAGKQLNRGLIWLGSAAAVGRVVDLGATVTVLFFLSKEEPGGATIACAIDGVLRRHNQAGRDRGLLLWSVFIFAWWLDTHQSSGQVANGTT